MNDIDVEPERQALILGAMLVEAMIEANGGIAPQNIWHYRRAARRFGVRLHLLPDSCNAQPRLRNGVIYLPMTRQPARLRCWLLHELAEAAARWDGVAPCVCQITRHEAACQAVHIALADGISRWHYRSEINAE